MAALPATLATASATGLAPAELATILPGVIGAVFGGAVLGDHCSPFSDTTIVTSLATGCEPTAHVISQLPFAALTAAAAAVAYTLFALGLPAALATALAGAVMLLFVRIFAALSPHYLPTGLE